MASRCSGHPAPVDLPARRRHRSSSHRPYFDHGGTFGAIGAAQGEDYEPPALRGPSSRFYDLVEGAKLMERGYTFVMVDLRGFGGSTGCLDWGGPGETADVVSAVEWAARSRGPRARWGCTASLRRRHWPDRRERGAEGLAAVIAQEPVYDLYRYLYGDGVRRLNSVLTPALYDGIAASPGPLLDDPGYNTSADEQHPASRLRAGQLG